MLPNYCYLLINPNNSEHPVNLVELRAQDRRDPYIEEGGIGIMCQEDLFVVEPHRVLHDLVDVAHIPQLACAQLNIYLLQTVILAFNVATETHLFNLCRSTLGNHSSDDLAEPLLLLPLRLTKDVLVLVLAETETAERAGLALQHRLQPVSRPVRDAQGFEQKSSLIKRYLIRLHYMNSINQIYFVERLLRRLRLLLNSRVVRVLALLFYISSFYTLYVHPRTLFFSRNPLDNIESVYNIKPFKGHESMLKKLQRVNSNKGLIRPQSVKFQQIIFLTQSWKQVISVIGKKETQRRAQIVLQCMILRELIVLQLDWQLNTQTIKRYNNYISIYNYQKVAQILLLLATLLMLLISFFEVYLLQRLVNIVFTVFNSGIAVALIVAQYSLDFKKNTFSMLQNQIIQVTVDITIILVPIRTIQCLFLIFQTKHFIFTQLKVVYRIIPALLFYQLIRLPLLFLNIFSDHNQFTFLTKFLIVPIFFIYWVFNLAIITNTQSIGYTLQNEGLNRAQMQTKNLTEKLKKTLNYLFNNIRKRLFEEHIQKQSSQTKISLFYGFTQQDLALIFKDLIKELPANYFIFHKINLIQRYIHHFIKLSPSKFSNRETSLIRLGLRCSQRQLKELEQILEDYQSYVQIMCLAQQKQTEEECKGLLDYKEFIEFMLWK